jgi:ethanolaminephosphotransferase
MPLWLAPNMITLLGFFFILGNVALLEVYIPDLVGPVRSATMLRGWTARTDEV